MIDLELRDPGAALIGNGRNEAMHFAVELQVFSDISPHRLQSASVIVGLTCVVHEIRRLAIMEGRRRLKKGSCRLERQPHTRSLPFFNSPSKAGISFGSFCASPSMRTTMSPSAYARPAAMAAV